MVLRADVSGKIVMKTYLSGMPECKFGMNDKIGMETEAAKNPTKRKPTSSGIVIDDVVFHRCVKLGQFEHDRTINFVPPDGEFELMKYRITENVNLPFRVIPVVHEHGRSRVEYEIKLKGMGIPCHIQSNCCTQHSMENLQAFNSSYLLVSVHIFSFFLSFSCSFLSLDACDEACV